MRTDYILLWATGGRSGWMYSKYIPLKVEMCNIASKNYLKDYQKNYLKNYQKNYLNDYVVIAVYSLALVSIVLALIGAVEELPLCATQS